MGTQASGSSGLNVFDEVLGLGEIDVGLDKISAQAHTKAEQRMILYLSTELLAHTSLLISTINSNNAQSHSLGILLSQRAKTTPSTNNSNSLARLRTRLLKSLVNSNTGTENWCNSIKGDLLWQLGHMRRLTNSILLEGTVNRISRELSIRTQRFIRGLAELACQARSIQPLDTRVVADLDALGQFTFGDDD